MDCPSGKDFPQPAKIGLVARGIIEEFTEKNCDAERKAIAMHKRNIVKEVQKLSKKAQIFQLKQAEIETRTYKQRDIESISHISQRYLSKTVEPTVSSPKSLHVHTYGVVKASIL
jgi:hypothetical protein